MIGKAIGRGFSAARDAVARVLLKLRITPNVLTILGMLLTLAAGVCYALAAGRGFAWTLAPAGPNAFVLLAGGLLVLSSACDMLDGAVARLGDKGTQFGAFLDSTMDRFSDFAVYAGLAVGYALAEPANVTFVLLSQLAFFNAFMISYTRARAEDLIDACRVGFWQRGERSTAILIGTFACNLPALVIQQALLPLGTALRRIFYTRRVIQGRDAGEDPRRHRALEKLQIWRWPRMTPPYDLTCALCISWLILVRIEPWDLLRRWLM
jgi:CDP-diacylglycerol--glycerol-3-phosphate 3-phosphatidyltransferase